VGSAALGVAHATSAITANVLTLRLANSILARVQLNPYLQGAQGKEVIFHSAGQASGGWRVLGI
jgi:hypothetical protein